MFDSSNKIYFSKNAFVSSLTNFLTPLSSYVVGLSKISVIDFFSSIIVCALCFANSKSSVFLGLFDKSKSKNFNSSINLSFDTDFIYSLFSHNNFSAL